MINPTIIPVRLGDQSLANWCMDKAEEKKLYMVEHKGVMKMVYKHLPKKVAVWESHITIMEDK